MRSVDPPPMFWSTSVAEGVDPADDTSENIISLNLVDDAAAFLVTVPLNIWEVTLIELPSRLVSVSPLAIREMSGTTVPARTGVMICSLSRYLYSGLR